MPENNKTKTSEKGKLNEKLKKMDKSKLFAKILAGILAALMILSIAATCIYAIINMVQK